MGPAPVALFVYNRPDHTRRTVDALSRNELASHTDLFVFSDGPKNESAAAAVNDVRRYLATVAGFRSIKITTRPGNAGLSRSIVGGVTEVVNAHGRVIVVEDDIETSAYFLSYMNQALNLYQDEPDVISIHGYMYPHRTMLPETFFLRGADCWGWATWRRGWTLYDPDGAALLAELKTRDLRRQFNFRFYPYARMLKAQVQGRIDSWAIRWYASAFLRGKLTLYPDQSLVRNIGLDGSGTHTKTAAGYFDSPVSPRRVSVSRIPIVEDIRARRELERTFLRARLRSVASAGGEMVRHPLSVPRRVGRLLNLADRSVIS